MTEYVHSLLLMKQMQNQKPVRIVCIDIEDRVYKDLSERFESLKDEPQKFPVNGGIMRYMALERPKKDLTQTPQDEVISVVPKTVVNIPQAYFTELVNIFEDKDISSEEKYKLFKIALDKEKSTLTN